MGNKIKYGLKNVHYAVATFDDDGNVTYSTPVKIPGAVNLELDADGDLDPWYIDNTLYAVVDTSKGYTGSLEMALIPESFSKDVLHDELDENYAVAEMVNDGEEATHFALMFQFDGDVNNIRHVMYNCICTHPAIASSTREETKDPQTDTLNLIAGALPNGYVKMKTSADTPNSIYNYWFQEVYTPNGEAPASFTVYFYNGTTLLQTVRDVSYGGSATYTGSTPVCKDDPNAEFTGWEPKPTNITKDTRCYAQFNMGTYTVYFYNGDTLLQTVTGVSYGGSATYTGSTPVSPDDPNLAFTGWEPEPVNITADTKCYAQFTSAAYTYFSVWFHPTEFTSGENVDSANVTISAIRISTGTTVYSQTKNLTYSSSSSYVSYDTWALYDDFDSWSDLTQKYDVDLSVDGYTVITKSTATSKNTSGGFTVRYNVTQLQNKSTFTVYFYNGSTLLQTVKDVPYGGSATYTGSTPINDEHPNLAFTGWDPEPTNITSDTKCYAQFETAPIVYFYVCFKAENYDTKEEIAQGNVTIKMTNIETGEIAYSETRTLTQSEYYTEFTDWTIYEFYDSWQELQNYYELSVEVSGYTMILKSVASIKRSNNFIIYIDIIDLIPN